MLKNPKPGDVVRWTASDYYQSWWPIQLGAGPFVVVSTRYKNQSIEVKMLNGSPFPTHRDRKTLNFGHTSLDPDVFLTAAHRAIHDSETR